MKHDVDESKKYGFTPTTTRHTHVRDTKIQ
jgi:hypothetical protein